MPSVKKKRQLYWHFKIWNDTQKQQYPVIMDYVFLMSSNTIFEQHVRSDEGMMEEWQCMGQTCCNEQEIAMSLGNSPCGGIQVNLGLKDIRVCAAGPKRSQC